MTIKTRDQIKAEAAANIEDNKTRNISPADIRQRVLDLADTMATREELSNAVAPLPVEQVALGTDNIQPTTALGVASYVNARLATDATPDTDDAAFSTPADVVRRAKSATWIGVGSGAAVRTIDAKLKDISSARDYGLDAAVINAAAAEALFLAAGDVVTVSGDVGKLYWGLDIPRVSGGGAVGDQGGADYGFSVVKQVMPGNGQFFAFNAKAFTGTRTDVASAPDQNHMVAVYGEAQRGAGSSDGVWALNTVTSVYNLGGASIGYEIDMNNYSGIDPGLDSVFIGLSVVSGANGKGGTAIEINRNGDFSGNQWNQGLHIKEVIQRGIDFTNCGAATGIWADDVIKLKRVDSDGPVAQLIPFNNINPESAALYLTNAENSQVLMQVLKRGEIVVGSPAAIGSAAISAKGIANGDNIVFLQRNTDTSPTGSFLACVNAANNTVLFLVDHNAAANESNMMVSINGVLKRVLKGAPDTAGAGASVLCVLN